MSRKYYFTGNLDYYEQLNCSVHGNPRYYAHFSNNKGEELEGKTASDTACPYKFLNRITCPQTVTYHYTRNGNVIIDNIVIRGLE